MQFIRVEKESDNKAYALSEHAVRDSICFYRESLQENGSYLLESWTRHPGNPKVTYAREYLNAPIHKPRAARFFKQSHAIEQTDPGHVVMRNIGTDCMAALWNPIHTPRIERLT